jgi:carotenoid cleavage dioxygenase-like enzyme
MRVTGTLPPWLRGTLTRVGPAVFEAKARDGSVVTFEHWFDGLPYVHRFEIADKGVVMYDSRHVGRHVERAAASVGNVADYSPLTVGTVINPGRGALRKLLTLFKTPTRDEGTPGSECFPIGVAIERNTVGSPFTLTTDAPHFLRLDGETLEPRQFVSYKDLGVAGGQLACAHGAYDPEEGAYYNLLLSITARRGTIRVVRFDSKTGAASVFAELADCPSTYAHSFAMTKRYIVVILGSARVDGVAALRERCFLSGMSFDATADTTFHVVDRRSGEHVSTHSAAPSFFFHVANAYDAAGDRIVIDVCRYDNLDIFHALNVPGLSTAPCGGSGGRERFPRSTLTTYTLADVNPPAGAVDPRRPRPVRPVAAERRLPQHIDLPRINDAFRGRPYRFVYGVAVNSSGAPFSAITKLDRASGAAVTHETPGRFQSEPIFCGDPSAAAAADEDGGVLVFVELDVRDAAAPVSALVVLDAASMAEVARCTTDVIIPLSFHGDFEATLL